MKNSNKLKQTTDRIILFFIYLSAFATALILVSIIGYITYRGLYRESRINKEILESRNIEYEFDNENYIFLVNKTLKRNSLNITELDQILEKGIKNWSSVSETRAKIKIISLFRKEKEINRTYDIRNISTAEEMIKIFKSEPGTIGIIPLSARGKINLKNLKILYLDKNCVAAGYKVTEIINNSRLAVLSEKDLVKITNGEVSNWKEVKGHDIPLEMLSTADQVAKSSGGFAVVDYRKAVESGVSIIPVSYVRKGANFTPGFLFDKPAKAGKAGGISTIIINTLFMIVLTLLFSVPVGVGAAVYLTEYAAAGKVLKIIRLGIETLAGIPSIIFGLFGFIFFVDILNMGIGLLSGSLTVAMMIIPVIIRTSEEALRSVPLSYREGSLALGAGLWYTIRKIVLPAAKPGILSGVILSIGRALGETAALVFTMGFDYRLANGIKSSARVLSVHLYQLVREGISFERAFATAFVLMCFIFIINTATIALVSGKTKYGEKQ